MSINASSDRRPFRLFLVYAATGLVALAAGFATLSSALAHPGEDCCEDKDGKAAAAAPKDGPLLVDLGNAKCPVLGGAVDGKTYSEWNGVRVGHCCPGCGAKFLADPAKLLDAAKIAWKDAVDAVKKAGDAKGDDRAKALATLKEKWKVVREPAVVPTGVLVDLGNKTCPVTGEEADGSSTVEWSGLRVTICCPECGKKVLADPAKMLDAAKIEWRKAAEAAKAVDAAKGEDRAKALVELKKTWKVVREPAAEEPAK